MEELLKILLGYVTKQYGISEDAVAELLFEKSEDGTVDKTKLKSDALTTLVAKDQERVTALKGSGIDKTEIFNQAYDKAKKDVLGKAEKELAGEYGVENGEGMKLPELVKHIVGEQTKAAKTAGKLTEDDIKKHPTYLALERAKVKELEDLNTAHEQKVKEIQDGYAKGQTLQTVKSEVLTLFDGLKPVLSKDPSKAANQRSVFASMFEQYDYEAQDGGGYLVLKDGKRVEDGHGNPISLDKLVQNTATQYYDFAVQDPKGNAGNGTGAGGAGGSGITVPTSDDEYASAIINATSAEERAAITEAYEASK